MCVLSGLSIKFNTNLNKCKNVGNIAVATFDMVRLFSSIFKVGLLKMTENI